MSNFSTYEFELLIKKRDNSTKNELKEIMFDLDYLQFTKEKKREHWKEASSLINSIMLLLQVLKLNINYLNFSSFFENYKFFKFDFKNEEHIKFLNELCDQLNIKITIFFIEKEFYEDNYFVNLKLTKSPFSFGKNNKNHHGIATWRVDNGLWIFAPLISNLDDIDNLKNLNMSKVMNHMVLDFVKCEEKHIDYYEIRSQLIAVAFLIHISKKLKHIDYEKMKNLNQKFHDKKEILDSKPKFFVAFNEPENCFARSVDEILIFFRRLLKNKEGCYQMLLEAFDSCYNQWECR